jgi:hypothetical protein
VCAVAAKPAYNLDALADLPADHSSAADQWYRAKLNAAIFGRPYW